MKALSLWQPWASLMVIRAKLIETRGHRINYRGLVALHAAKKWTRAEREAADEFRHFVKPLVLPAELPRGAILASARLVDIRPMTRTLIGEQTELELECGNWQEGRYAWIFEDLIPLEHPIYINGMQGLFEVPVFCRLCGCTEADCRRCIARTGRPCLWTSTPATCSACVTRG